MQKQKIWAASTSVVGIILVAALLVMANWLGYRHYVRGDWTKAKMYSLSDKTLNIVKDIKDDVKITVFMTPSTPLFTETKELLDRYKAKSPKISVEYIDPERDPLRTRTLAQEFGVSAANTVVFASGANKKYVTSDQLAEYDYSGMQMGQPPTMKGFKGEEQFTSAIFAVVNPKTPKIYFTQGHGELDPESMSQDGISQLKEMLKRDNLEVAKTSLLSGQTPGDADLIVIAGPKVPFAEQEKTALTAYLDMGGRLLALLDPVITAQQRPAGLDDLLKGRGVQLNSDVVLDPAKRLPFVSLASVYADEFRSHPVVDRMQRMAVLLPLARSVATVTAPGATSSILLVTSDQGWGETNLAELLKSGQANKDDKDTQAPVPLGVAAQSETDKEKGWRLIVFGNSQFIGDGQISNVGNVNLALNAVNWLVKREAAIGIAPRSPEQVHLYLSAAQLRNTFLISLVGLPLAGIVLGVVVWLRRRRA
jgi:ABC-type uncharacterized transport system involved in gliding motility auxiliary subunit